MSWVIPPIYNNKPSKFFIKKKAKAEKKIAKYNKAILHLQEIVTICNAEIAKNEEKTATVKPKA